MTAPIAAGSLRGPRVRIDRELDRRITVAGVTAAGAFVAAAAASLLLPPAGRIGFWLPLHLALAGGASTAIAAVLPFFSATLAVAPPAPGRWRALAVGLVAVGTLLVAAGHASGADPVATAGTGAYLAGMALAALVALLPLRGALGPRRRLVEIAYAAAFADILVGAGAAALFVAGSTRVASDWAMVKPGHAWLNLLGFLALVITGTLVHLAPTIAGTRIRPRRAATIAVAGLVIAGPLVAGGYWAANGALARAGAALAVVGAVATLGFVLEVIRERGRWTTDRDWHLAATGHMIAATTWFAVGMTVAAGRVVVAGADPAAWRLDLVAAPLVAGWVLQMLAGAWTHLVPPLGSGHPALHARRRIILGRAALPRLIAWNAGVAASAVGTWGGLPDLAIGGAMIGGWAVTLSIALLARSLLEGPGER